MTSRIRDERLDGRDLTFERCIPIVFVIANFAKRDQQPKQFKPEFFVSAIRKGLC